MTLVLARRLEDPEQLWQELQSHWRAGQLVGLARPEEGPELRRAVLGPRRGSEPTADAAAGERAPLGARGSRLGGDAPASASPLANREPAVVLGSGGSSGGRRWCLQPLAHLQAAAAACGAWLRELGLDPGSCLHLDALPLHHVSGLMPLVRAMQWQAELHWLPPELLRSPAQLDWACPLPPRRPVLLSLVPTQLHRLLREEAAVRWLRSCSVIWVGGAALEGELAERARRAELPLAPCYGATETAAMVCALPPARFLAGEPGCGPALADVELRLEDSEQAIAVRTARLSPGWFAAGRLQPFCDADGWWRSGDAGVWQPGTAPAPDGADAAPGGPPGRPQPHAGVRQAARTLTPPRSAGGRPGGMTTVAGLSPTPASQASLVVVGRLDGAIHSGGETVFPDQVQQRLLELIQEQGLPVEALLLLAETDALWGERLVALVRWRMAEPGETGDPGSGRAGSNRQTRELRHLIDLARALPPPQRPSRWLACPDLEANAVGKWERRRWRDWLRQSSAPEPSKRQAGPADPAGPAGRDAGEHTD